MISRAQQMNPAHATSGPSPQRSEVDRAPADRCEAAQPEPGSREIELWGQVMLRAIEDYKAYMAYRKDPRKHPLSPKTLRSILADGCDPEYWFFAKRTGFDAVCMVLDLEPDCVRRLLRGWTEKTLGIQPSY